MITNPGGQLDPEDIVGRDNLIGDMWVVLDGRCIYMNDLRRIGKTQIMVKMKANAPPGWLCVKRDLGVCHTAEEFAQHAYEDSSAVLTGGKKATRRMGKLLGKLAGTEIPGVLKLPDGSVAPWKEVLERTFRDIHKCAESDGSRMLFMWDEVPFLIDNIAKRQGAAVAMEVLDVIRALTQQYDRVRVLLTGSIGLHHVLQSLNEEGYSGSPLNRMEFVRPGPLSDGDATNLAQRLLQGEDIRVDDLDQCAAAIAECAGYVPFYIHKLISRLDKAAMHSPQSIAEMLDTQLADRNSDWDLEHYRNRLKNYYGENLPSALAILDAIAIRRSAKLEEIRSDVAAQMPVEIEQIRIIIDLLCKDHYLAHAKNGKYHFYLEIVARWWRISRDLEPKS